MLVVILPASLAVAFHILSVAFFGVAVVDIHMLHVAFLDYYDFLLYWLHYNGSCCRLAPGWCRVVNVVLAWGRNHYSDHHYQCHHNFFHNRKLLNCYTLLFNFDVAKLRQKQIRCKRITLNSGREIHKEGREYLIILSSYVKILILSVICHHLVLIH